MFRGPIFDPIMSPLGRTRRLLTEFIMRFVHQQIAFYTF